MTNSELLSKTISYLRLPLIIGVVFIHNNMREITIQGKTIDYDDWSWLTYIMEFFSSVLPTIAFLVGLIATTHIVSELIRTEKVSTKKFLSDASFFVFAAHGLFISRFMKLLILAFHPESPYTIPICLLFCPDNNNFDKFRTLQAFK